MTEKEPPPNRTGGGQVYEPRPKITTSDDNLRFDLPIYQGPLDLLLHLIKRAELDPHDVTASIITEQYLTHMDMLQELNLEVAGEYLVMAATLLLIKSYALLPHPELAENEEAEELRRDLVERLLEYQRYREAAAKLGERAILGRDVFIAPGEKPPEPDASAPPYRVTLFDLVQAMAVVLKRLTDQRPRAILLRDIPVAQCVPRILAALTDDDRIEFIALFETLDDRAMVIATFMALLELMRRGSVRAWQDDRDGPIYLGRGDRFGAPLEMPAAPSQTPAVAEESGSPVTEEDAFDSKN